MTDKEFHIDNFNPLAIAEKLAQRLKQKRILLNISQQILSEKSGVSLGSIKRFEQTAQISLKHLLNIALVLNSLDEFHNLFPNNHYQSVDDIIKQTEIKTRKRARNV